MMGGQREAATEPSAGPRVLRAWLWVMLCIAAIWTMSGDGFSGMHTSRFVRPFFQWLFPDLTGRDLNQIHFWVRKSAHLAEYALLGVLSLRALHLTLDVPFLRVAALALAIVLAVAGADEWRQSFLPTRTGSLGDVAINLAGGTLGVALVIAIHRVLGVGAPATKESS
jgi:VanZ family protein